MLLWSIPLLGAIVLLGAILDALITWRMNSALSPAFQTLRDLQNQQGRSHFTIFATLLTILGNVQEKCQAVACYAARYDAFTTQTSS